MSARQIGGFPLIRALFLTSAQTSRGNLLAGLWLGADSGIRSSTPMRTSVTRRRRATSKEGREGRSLSPAENNGEPCRETHKGLCCAGVKGKTDVQQSLSNATLPPSLLVTASLWRQFYLLTEVWLFVLLDLESTKEFLSWNITQNTKAGYLWTLSFFIFPKVLSFAIVCFDDVGNNIYCTAWKLR